MKDVSKKLNLLHKKREYMENDLFKSVASDLLWSLDHEDLVIPPSKRQGLYFLIKSLSEKYKEEYYNLVHEQKQKSKQIDIEDVIKEIKKQK